MIPTSNVDQDIDFKALVELSEDAIMKFDLEHRHVYVNRKVEEQTGIKTEDFIGKTHQELGFPNHLNELWEKAIDHTIKIKANHRVEFTLPKGNIIDWYLIPEKNTKDEVVGVLTYARDITEIRNAEEIKVKSEEKFKRTQDNLEDAVQISNLQMWEFDIVKEELSVDNSMLTHLGVHDIFGEGPLKISDYFRDYVHVDDRSRLVAAYQKAKDSEDQNYRDIIEYRLDVDGHIVYLLLIIHVLKDENGNNIRAYGTAQDITDLKKISIESEKYRQTQLDIVEVRSQELKLNQGKLPHVDPFTQLISWELDSVTNNLRTNSEFGMAYFDKSKIKNGEISFEDFISHIHKDDIAMVRNAYKAIKKTNDQDYIDSMECKIHDVYGSIRDLFLSIKVKINEAGLHTKYFGTIQDITSLRRYENERQKLSDIVENTTDIIAIISPEKRINYLNKAGKLFYGLSDEDTIDLPIENLQSEKSKEVLEFAWIHALENGVWIGENLILDNEGNEIPVSQVIIAHINKKGRLDCYSSIVRDLSRQKQIEEELTAKNTELDTFVYKASHDLRGPLTSLIGLNTLVKMDITDPKAMEYFDVYHNQIMRLNNLILDLINITRIKEKSIEKERVDFGKITSEIIDSFSNHPNFSKQTLRIDIDEDLEYYNDKGLVTSVIQNLVENAVKYAKPIVEGKINLTVRNKDKDNLLIEITDTGIGIKEEYQTRIYDMFFRASEQAEGSGLGLFILKSAVEKLKGKIDLESEFDKGTTFSITLPYI